MSAPRLPQFDYKGNFAYSITICCNQGKNHFTKDATVQPCLNILKNVMDQEGFDIYAYCFMPDHLHLLLIGKNENVDMNKTIKLYKQKTGYWFKQQYKEKIWQNSYYDHIIRKEEGIENVALYIFNNPIRKGLVNDFIDYPYLGSFVFDIKEV
ncbi:MAG: hypothetical protein COY82_01960 [Parcubacteria group bacterium CG_4_10_14_0_8_um_filter_35_7]|nr:MAG: hypothetical protein COY82_01960 [Parcubacteria group bacterium CG_4_10_14_0_8_um_filter_35_7]